MPRRTQRQNPGFCRCSLPPLWTTTTSGFLMLLPLLLALFPAFSTGPDPPAEYIPGEEHHHHSMGSPGADRGQQYVFEGEDLCTDRSCYPATGNLLIGRKKQLTASSTCGLRAVENYCIVSHLEDDTKCFYCDSRFPWQPSEMGRRSHRIENVVSENYEDRTQNWWQSENGVQNVSIRLDLEAEFHFTHLIMTFRSFRPAAMLIERSSDFGKTWSVYRYFAYDCSSSFPGVPEGPPRNHGDVICSRRYSDVAPSIGGELVYKVISPHIPTADPYAPEITRLLKITNLRINFTKLHTLGDDLIDPRSEIRAKYYYAVFEVVVRGSCSCYGHAQRCIPIGDETAGPQGMKSHPDMVHGRCECTHNTKGLNCEQCQDFYNDIPWAPAFGEHSNECRRCECNSHASRCHFDAAVYNSSGFVSGGVCDDCMHNTQGKNCEQCRPYFYRDPQRPLHDPYVCRPCECDKRGSLYEGICEGEEDPDRGLVAGKCYCKANVDGTNCGRCKNGFWDLREEDPDGCRPCTCSTLGTVNNEGCDKHTGSCTCKPLVTGANCDRCLEHHYGLSEDPYGCKPCDCDIGGAMDNHCDVTTGQCKCRQNFSGRRCNTTESSFYCASLDLITLEAEHAGGVGPDDVVHREPYSGRPQTWTGEGFARIREGSNLTFQLDGIIRSGHYNLVIRYELEPNDAVGWEDIKITLVRFGDPSPDGPCASVQPSDDYLIARLQPQQIHSEVYPYICLEAGQRYEIRVYFGNKRLNYPDLRPIALIDSLVIAPPTEGLPIFMGSEAALRQKQIYDLLQCRAHALKLTPHNHLPAECRSYICPVAGLTWGPAIECDCDPTGSISSICNSQGGQCECKANVVGRRCDRCAVGTFGFGPNGCTACDCDSVGALSNACDKTSGQCVCRERGITGRQCNQCQPGFWSFPDCRTCQCNGHASICDQRTGHCIDCKDLTDGEHCERCVMGYYGDPRLGISLPCKPCPCPGGPGSGFQHADTCWLSGPPDQSVVCNCRAGYTGERCDRCAVNHWGSPSEIGGTCEPCDCNDNIDRAMPESCDARTGDCLKCLHNTAGDQCEHCIDGFYGDARTRTCIRCICNQLGTNVSAGVCDRITGQCPCLQNVVGQQCDQCAPFHYNLASEQGCSPCHCDPNGVVQDPALEGPFLECNLITGQCHCKAGRGGRTCSDCQDYYWGDPVNGECLPCECDPHGSKSLQCNRNNGICECRPDSGGPRCNECARGYTGTWPHCQACGECFDSWDRILQGIRSDLEGLIDRASNIEDTAISPEYDETFASMESQIAEVKQKLEAMNITKEDVDDLKQQMELLGAQIEAARETFAAKNQRITSLATDVNLAEASLNTLNESLRTIDKASKDLQARADEIRGGDSQGAAEIVDENARKSAEAERTITQQLEKIGLAESDRIKAERLLAEHRRDFDSQYEENQRLLEQIGTSIVELEQEIPGLNKEVCGAEAAPCDSICGGPTQHCSHCGGSSCPGSVSKAAQAREFAEEAAEKIQAKQREAEEILKRVREVMPSVEAAQRSTNEALQAALEEQDRANKTRASLIKQINETRTFLEASRNTPADIAALVDQILNISIPFNEDHIRQLSENIRLQVLEVKDADKILEETRGNKSTAMALQRAAERANERASRIHNITQTIKEALDKAEKAQDDTQAMLEDITAKIEQARKSISSTDTEVGELETKAAEAAERIRKLNNATNILKAEYIKITSNSKAATASANQAATLAKGVSGKHDALKESFEKVRGLLEQRETGNEERKKRAEALRRRTTDLLAKIRRSREEKNSLIERADALDVELSGFRKHIDLLSAEIEQVYAEIDRRVEYHATCDA